VQNHDVAAVPLAAHRDGPCVEFADVDLAHDVRDGLVAVAEIPEELLALVGHGSALLTDYPRDTRARQALRAPPRCGGAQGLHESGHGDKLRRASGDAPPDAPALWKRVRHAFT
jgi:hypothetical protein